MSQPTSTRSPRIVLGVSGSIAAVKSLELVRRLQEMPADVRVAMTPSAAKMIAPVTFAAMSQHSVYSDVWQGERAHEMEHLSWAKWADVLLIAPASANLIAGLAHGRADDAVTTTALAWDGLLVICPAMNPSMWAHPATQANVATLQKRGAVFLGPAPGLLLCGDEGHGRLVEVPEIVAAMKKLLSGHREESPMAPAPAGPWRGLRVLITAGPTREPIDPVRYITNPSSGKMGIAVAVAAARRGATVDLIAGPVSIPLPEHPLINVQQVMTADTMHEAAMALSDDADVCIFTAAVGDYAPATIADSKIKKTGKSLMLELRSTPDIAFDIGQRNKPNQVRVGFAAETEDLGTNAVAKLHRKNLHVVCANDVTGEGTGFASDTNALSLFYRDGHRHDLPLMPKPLLAEMLLDELAALLPLSTIPPHTDAP